MCNPVSFLGQPDWKLWERRNLQGFEACRILFLSRDSRDLVGAFAIHGCHRSKLPSIADHYLTTTPSSITDASCCVRTHGQNNPPHSCVLLMGRTVLLSWVDLIRSDCCPTGWDCHGGYLVNHISTTKRSVQAVVSSTPSPWLILMHVSGNLAAMCGWRDILHLSKSIKIRQRPLVILMAIRK